MLISKKHSTLEKTRSLQVSPAIMTVPFKYMAGSTPLKLQYNLNRNICQIHCICKIHGCTQPAFTCSKLTIETLEQGVKYVQS